VQGFKNFKGKRSEATKQERDLNRKNPLEGTCVGGSNMLVQNKEVSNKKPQTVGEIVSLDA